MQQQLFQPRVQDQILLFNSYKKGSGIVTNVSEVIDYAIAATDIPLAEVNLTAVETFSTAGVVGKLFTDLIGGEHTFPNDASAYQQLEEIVGNDPFYVVVRVGDTFPENASTINPHVRYFAETMRGLTAKGTGIKLLAYSPHTENIPLELKMNLYPMKR